MSWADTAIVSPMWVYLHALFNNSTKMRSKILKSVTKGGKSEGKFSCNVCCCSRIRLSNTSAMWGSQFWSWIGTNIKGSVPASKRVSDSKSSISFASRWHSSSIMWKYWLAWFKSSFNVFDRLNSISNVCSAIRILAMGVRSSWEMVLRKSSFRWFSRANSLTCSWADLYSWACRMAIAHWFATCCTKRISKWLKLDAFGLNSHRSPNIPWSSIIGHARIAELLLISLDGNQQNATGCPLNSWS